MSALTWLWAVPLVLVAVVVVLVAIAAAVVMWGPVKKGERDPLTRGMDDE